MNLLNLSEKTQQKAIEFVDVYKRYRNTLPLLNTISLSVGYGEVVGLFGPSGSGKSTILQMAAALISPDSGRVSIDNNQIFPAASRIGVNVAKLRSSIMSYLPQDDFLFESLNVAENVSLALQLNQAKSDNDEQNDRVDLVLKSVNIEHLANRLISDISAGERKRVAIARSLVRNPRIIIADEPTSSLDLENTNDLLRTISRKAKDERLAFFIASHDVLEVKGVADRVYGIKNCTLFKVES